MLAFVAFVDDGDLMCLRADSELGLLRTSVSDPSVCVAIGASVCPAGISSGQVAVMCVVAGGGWGAEDWQTAHVQRERRLRCVLAVGSFSRLQMKYQNSRSLLL